MTDQPDAEAPLNPDHALSLADRNYAAFLRRKASYAELPGIGDIRAKNGIPSRTYSTSRRRRAIR